MSETKKCGNCGNCVRIDQGYSSYTVEGTDLYCWLDLNPAMPFDDWYGTDERHLFAESCPSFTHDEDSRGFTLDVDGDDWADLTDDQKSWCLAHEIDRRPYNERLGR